MGGFSISCTACGMSEDWCCGSSDTSYLNKAIIDGGWRVMANEPGEGVYARYRCSKCPDDTPDKYDFLGIPLHLSPRNEPVRRFADFLIIPGKFLLFGLGVALLLGLARAIT